MIFRYLIKISSLIFIIFLISRLEIINIDYGDWDEYLNWAKQYQWLDYPVYKMVEFESKNRIDKKIIFAIIDAESGGNHLAVSKSGARGLMQIMAKYWYKNKNPNDLFHKGLNIKLGVNIFLFMLNRARGNLVLALRNYERGCAGKHFNVNYTAKIIQNIYGKIRYNSQKI